MIGFDDQVSPKGRCPECVVRDREIRDLRGRVAAADRLAKAVEAASFDHALDEDDCRACEALSELRAYDDHVLKSSGEGADAGDGSDGSYRPENTPDRQGGEGERLNAALSPKSLPADLIDRAAKGLARGVWTSPFGGRLTPAEIARIVLIEVEPLLVEHGRRQRWPREAIDAAEARGAAAEKARWEARIEKLATWEDRAWAEQSRVARWHEESGSKMAREVRDDEYRHAYTGRVLRSLLTGEGDGE